MDEQKIADDKFFRTTLYVPVVADCEIMCWPFWEHALLIRVCLVVYKKLIIPSPHCHHPIPHLMKPGQPPSKASSADGGAGSFMEGKTCRQPAMQVSGWERADATEHKRSKPITHHTHFLEFIFQKHLLGYTKTCA